MTLRRFFLTYPASARHFVLLDPNGICLAFKSCPSRPRNGNWVDVEEICLAWLHHPLPATALKHTKDSESH